MEENRKKMIASVESSSSEQSKMTGEHGKDIISFLPEEIRNNVVSFLSTKDAVKTSILSKRWQYVWTSLSDFVLTDGGKADVLNFVDRIFTLHGSTDIRRFHITLGYPVCYSRLDTCIRGAMEHNVQNLMLKVFSYSGGIAFPWSSFACHSMVILNIFAQFPLKATEPVFFSNLKTLHLCLITFSDELSVQHIFSGCLVLEKLSLKHCKLKYADNVTISIPTLRSLILKDNNVGGDVVDCQLKISAVNLKYLKCVSDLQLDICFGEFSCLEHAKIGVRYSSEWKEEAPLRAFKLFTAVRNTKSLELPDYTLLIFEEFNALLDKFNTFDRLTHLKVNSGFYSVCPNILMEFLGKTPKLKHLHLAGMIDDDAAQDDLDHFKGVWSKRWEQHATLSIT